MTKKTICIISLSPIYRDARVLRQIKYLSPHYNLTVVGYGPPHPDWKDVPSVQWVSLDPKAYWEQKQSAQSSSDAKSLAEAVCSFKKKLPPAVRWAKGRLIDANLDKIRQKINFIKLGVLARLFLPIYERHYWKKYARVFKKIVAIPCDAYHANDWVTLPMAAESAKQNNARVVCDLHEYAPLQYEYKPGWKQTDAPMITYFLKKYAPFLAASSTVGAYIAERYTQEYGQDGLTPMVIFSAPEYQEVPHKEPDPQNIKLIHHGGSMRARRLELLIEALALCDQRYSLHFMLVDVTEGYTDELKLLAQKIAPGRVFFHPPARPEEIVATIANYDIGLSIIVPASYNYHMSLPNKFFDSIVAGLAICIGPSPEMAKLVNQYGCGCVTPSFEPQDVANTLNQLTIDNIKAMQQASREAAKHLNADVEMGKVVDLYARLLADKT